MATKPAALPRCGDWDDGGDVGDALDDDAPSGGRRLDTVAEVLAALPPGDAGRTLKLALLDALEASTRADRVALPLEVQGLRARVRAGDA